MELPKHKCGLYLVHNEHKDIYEKAEEWLEDNVGDEDISEETRLAMIAADSIWSLQWYPDTPVGFYKVYGPTLKSVLEKANGIES